MSRWKAIFEEFFPHTIIAAIVFFSLAGIILVQSFIQAANGNGLPVVSNVSVTVDPNGSIYYLAVEGNNFTPSSVVRFDGIDKPTTFVDSSKLVVNIPVGVYNPDASVDISVFNYAPYSRLIIKGTNFLADSVVRVDGKDLSTTYINGNQLEADLSGVEVGKRNFTVFSGSTKTESDAIPLEIPENSAPVSGEEINTILALARAEGVEIPAELPAADDYNAKKVYENILNKVTEKQEIQAIKQDVQSIAGDLGVAVSAPSASESLEDLKRAQADLLAKAKFFSDKQEAISLAQQAGLANILFPKDDDANAAAFYASLIKKAQDRLKAFKLVDSGILEKADKYNISRSGPPSPGTDNELAYYLNIDRLVQDYEKAHPEIFAPAISSLSVAKPIAGQIVTINGVNFSRDDNRVYLDGRQIDTRIAVDGIPANAQTIASFDGNKLTVMIPRYITVATPYASGLGSYTSQQAIIPGAHTLKVVTSATTNNTSKEFTFTVGQAPAPTIASIAPASGYVNQTVTIRGTGFSLSGNTISLTTPPSPYGRTFAAISGVSSADGTTLTFAAPNTGTQISISGGGYVSTQQGISFPNGSYDLSITNADNAESNIVNFMKIIAPAPTISSVSPARPIPGQAITITGAGFSTSYNLVVLTNSGGESIAIDTRTEVDTIPANRQPIVSSNGATLNVVIPRYYMGYSDTYPRFFIQKLLTPGVYQLIVTPAGGQPSARFQITVQ